jgi:hypothetical protein
MRIFCNKCKSHVFYCINDLIFPEKYIMECNCKQVQGYSAIDVIKNWDNEKVIYFQS